MVNLLATAQAFDELTAYPQSGDGGRPLPPEILAWLSEVCRTDLQVVRVHTGPTAHAITTLLGADACTIGCDVYFAEGAYAPDTATGRFLLAHELAHVVQQSDGRVPGPIYLSTPGDEFERHADEFATRAVTGIPLDEADLGVNIARNSDRPIVQCHDSFEHRALGDLQTESITTITSSTDPGLRTEILQRQLKLLWLWHQDPLSVTEQQVTELCPWIRTLRLQASGLLVTTAS